MPCSSLLGSALALFLPPSLSNLRTPGPQTAAWFKLEVDTHSVMFSCDKDKVNICNCSSSSDFLVMFFYYLRLLSLMLHCTSDADMSARCKLTVY